MDSCYYTNCHLAEMESSRDIGIEPRNLPLDADSILRDEIPSGLQEPLRSLANIPDAIERQALVLSCLTDVSCLSDDGSFVEEAVHPFEKIARYGCLAHLRFHIPEQSLEDEIKRNMAKARQVIASIENMMLGDLPSVLEEPLNWNRILHWSLASLGASMFSKPENLYSYMRWQADYIYTKNEAADREGRFQLPIRSLFRFLRDQSGEPVVFVDYGLIKYAEDHYVKVMKDLPSYFLSNKEGSFPKWWRHLAHLEVLRSGPLVGRQCVCPFKGRKIIAVPNAAQIDLTPLGEINDDEMRRIVRGSFLGASYSSSATLEICEAGCLLKLGSILGWPGITSCD